MHTELCVRMTREGPLRIVADDEGYRLVVGTAVPREIERAEARYELGKLMDAAMERAHDGSGFD